MNKDLALQRDIVSVEAFVVSDVTALLKGVFPAIREAFGGAAASFNPGEKAVELTPSHRNFVRQLPKHSYVDIKELSAYVPEGLDVTMREYADALLPATIRVKDIQKTLSDFSVYLAQVVSNNQLRLSTDDQTIKYKEMEKTRAEMNKDMGACFAKGSTRTEVSIGKVVQRNADWEDLFNMSEVMTKNVLAVDRPKLIKAVKEAVDLVDAIQRKLKTAEMDGVSPYVVQNLSDGAYQIASELEFYSVVFYKVEVFNQCLNRTIEHFEKVMKA